MRNESYFNSSYAFYRLQVHKRPPNLLSPGVFTFKNNTHFTESKNANMTVRSRPEYYFHRYGARIFKGREGRLKSNTNKISFSHS